MKRLIDFNKKKKEQIKKDEFYLDSISKNFVAADTTVEFPTGFPKKPVTDLSLTNDYVLLGGWNPTDNTSVTTLGNISTKLLSDYTVKSLVAGTGIDVKNNNGAWTINNTGGTGGGSWGTITGDISTQSDLWGMIKAGDNITINSDTTTKKITINAPWNKKDGRIDICTKVDLITSLTDHDFFVVDDELSITTTVVQHITTPIGVGGPKTYTQTGVILNNFPSYTDSSTDWQNWYNNLGDTFVGSKFYRTEEEGVFEINYTGKFLNATSKKLSLYFNLSGYRMDVDITPEATGGTYQFIWYAYGTLWSRWVGTATNISSYDYNLKLLMPELTTIETQKCTFSKDVLQNDTFSAFMWDDVAEGGDNYEPIVVYKQETDASGYPTLWVQARASFNRIIIYSSGSYNVKFSSALGVIDWGEIQGDIKDQADIWKNEYAKIKGDYTYNFNKDFSAATNSSGFDWWIYKTGTIASSATAAFEMRYHTRGDKGDSYARLRIADGSWSTDDTPVYTKTERFFDALPLGSDAKQVIAVADLSTTDFTVSGGKVKLVGGIPTGAKWGTITGDLDDQDDLMAYLNGFMSVGSFYEGVTNSNYSRYSYSLEETDGAQMGVTGEFGTLSSNAHTPTYSWFLGGDKVRFFPRLSFFSGNVKTGTIQRELNPMPLTASTLTYVPSVSDFDTNVFEVKNGSITLKAGGEVVSHDNTLTGQGTTSSVLGLNIDKSIITKTLSTTDGWSVRTLKAAGDIQLTQDSDKSGVWTISTKADPGVNIYWGNMIAPTTGTYKDLRAQTDLMEYLWGGTLPATIPALPSAGQIGYLAAVVGNTYSITKNSVKGTAALFLSKPDTSVVNDGLLRMIIQNDNSNIKESRIDFGQVMKDASSATCYLSVKSYKTDGTTINLERKIDAYPISSTSTANLVALGDFSTDDFSVTNNKITIKGSHTSSWGNITGTISSQTDLWGMLTAGTGISLTPNTSTGKIQITNTGVSTITGAEILAASADSSTVTIGLDKDGKITYTAHDAGGGVVTSVKAGKGISVDPTSGKGDVTVTNIGVTKIIAGTNISISPNTGIGDITINASSTGGVFSTNFIGAGTTASPTDLAQNIKIASSDGKIFWALCNTITSTDYGLVISKDSTSSQTQDNGLIIDSGGGGGETQWGDITGSIKDQKDLCQLMPEAITATHTTPTGTPGDFISEIVAGTNITLTTTAVSDSTKKGQVLTITAASMSSVKTDGTTITGDGSATTPLKLKFPLVLPADAVITIG